MPAALRPELDHIPFPLNEDYQFLQTEIVEKIECPDGESYVLIWVPINLYLNNVL